LKLFWRQISSDVLMEPPGSRSSGETGPYRSLMNREHEQVGKKQSKVLQ
jgi:hypothetical protein